MSNLDSNYTRQRIYQLFLASMLVLPFGLMAYKLLGLGYPMANLIPAVSYHVDVSMQVTGHGDAINNATYLPVIDSRQRISNEVNYSPGFAFQIENEGRNRIARWQGESVEGVQNIVYSYDVQGRAVRYNIPERLKAPASYPPELNVYLKEEEGIQVSDPLIQQEIDKLYPEGTDLPLFEILVRAHRHLQDNFANRNFSGFTDALTALKLGEASCNGKGRLFVAMMRKLNIPARLVGGLVLEAGSKRTSHQWIEVYVNGHWVPFDTINDHFASLPAHYLTLYYGDKVLFRHTANVNYQYFFKMTKRLVPQPEAEAALAGSVLNLVNIYSIFEQVGISQNLLKIILMIPLGALIVVIFRNVIGLETFGTFLPALIAAAARETGLLWGMIGFVVIILLSAAVRRMLDWMQLLHSPKMAIMLTTVVIVMLLMTVAGVNAGLFELAHMTLFPIAILAITSERFAIIQEEQGFQKAMRMMMTTIVVIAAAYWVMDSLFLQSLILAFPELLLFVIGLNLWLGKWVGLRVSEFIRFRKLIFTERKQGENVSA